jgi:hypothetical protein
MEVDYTGSEYDTVMGSSEHVFVKGTEFLD